MRVLEGSEIAYDDQAHRWIVLGYVYSSTGAHTPSTAYDEEDEPDTVRERMRAYMHAEYLARPKDSPSIVGTYLIDCKALYDPWPDQPILSIRTTSLPGVYQASYNFGRTMGPIMLSTDRKLLAYFTGEDGEEHGEEDEEEDGEEDREEDGGEDGEDDGDREEAKEEVHEESEAEPLVYHTVMRSWCVNSGDMNYEPERGTIRFSPNFATFAGISDMSYEGDDVPYTGRKISSKPGLRLQWEEYCSAAARW